MKLSLIQPGVRRVRITAVALAAMIASFSVISLSAGAATKGPTLVVYAAEGYDKATVAAFNATNPGFSVTLNDNSTGPLLQQIQAEGHNPKWGILWVDGATAFAQLDQEGYLVKHMTPKGPLQVRLDDVESWCGDH